MILTSSPRTSHSLLRLRVNKSSRAAFLTPCANIPTLVLFSSTRSDSSFNQEKHSRLGIYLKTTCNLKVPLSREISSCNYHSVFTTLDASGLSRNQCKGRHLSNLSQATIAHLKICIGVNPSCYNQMTYRDRGYPKGDKIDFEPTLTWVSYRK